MTRKRHSKKIKFIQNLFHKDPPVSHKRSTRRESTENKICPTEETEISFSYDSNFKRLGNDIWKGNSLTIPINNLPSPVLSSCGLEKDRVLLISTGLIRRKSPRKKAKCARARACVCVYIYTCPHSWLEKERRSKSKNRSHVFPVRLRDKRNCCLWASSLCSFTKS